MDLSLNSDVKYEAFKKGDVLFKEGAKHENCFIITSGKVALVRKHDKRDSVFYITKDKDIIGEDSVLSSEKLYHYSAVALDDVEAIPIKCIRN
jgi:CRP-like cAMP-binding protein